MKEINMNKVNKFTAYKFKHKFNAKNVREELNKLIEMKSEIFNHYFRYDFEDKYYYLYDNECYLFVFDKKIEIRSDRENVFSSNKIFTHQITDAKTIQTAYEHFCSMTMENDEEY